MISEGLFWELPPSKQCLVTSKISNESPDVVPIEWRHFYSIMFIPAGGAVVSMIVLMIEVRVFKNKLRQLIRERMTRQTAVNRYNFQSRRRQ